MNLNNDLFQRFSQHLQEYKKLEVQSNGDVKQIDASVEQPESEFNVDAINDRLGQGDKDALTLLSNNKIPYTLAENTDGYIVKYSYNGTNYTITYYAQKESDKTDNSVVSDTTTEEKPEVDTDTTTGTSGLGEDEAMADDDSKYSWFDYSVIEDLDAEIGEYWVNPYADDNSTIGQIKSDLSKMQVASYDAAFEELSKIKPQLQEYIKKELETLELEYDEAVVDKYLNMFITKAITTAVDATRSLNNPTVYSLATGMPQDATMEDIVNFVINEVDFALGKGRGNSLSQDADRIQDVFEALKGQLKPENQFKNEKIESYDYLFDTADYFLSDDEQKLKTAMNATEKTGYLTAQNEGELGDWIDTYAVRMKALLMPGGEKFNISEDEIDSIIKQAKEGALDNAQYISESKQLYNVGDVLKDFKARCEKLFAEYNN